MEEISGRASARYWTVSRILATALAIIAIAGVAMLIVRMSSFLLLVFAAVVLAVVFDAITRALCSVLPVGRGPSLGIAVVLLLGTFFGALFLFGAQLTNEFDTIRQSLPGAVDRLQAALDQMGLGEAVNGALEQGKKSMSGVISSVGPYMLAVGNGLTNLVLVIFAAIFLAADPDVYRRGFLHLVPEKAIDVAEASLSDAWRGLNGWMKGQAVSSVVVACQTAFKRDPRSASKRDPFSDMMLVC